MIKTTAKVEFKKTNNYFVWSRHTFYDTTVDVLVPPITRQYTRLNIQWKNIWELIKRTLTPKRRYVPQFAFAGVYEPAWVKFYRFAIALVGSPYRNDDWVSAGDAEQTGVHGTIATITITGVDATGADILVARMSCDGTGKTISSTYAGDSLTELVSVNTNRGSYIHYKGSPTTGSNTFVGTFSSADNGFGLLCFYSGTAGTMSGGQSAATSGTSVSKAVTTVSGDVAVDCLCIGTAASSITIGAGQIQRGTDTSDGWFHEFRGSDETATGTSTTMSWSWTTAANHAYTAGNIDQAAAAPATTPSPRKRHIWW